MQKTPPPSTLAAILSKLINQAAANPGRLVPHGLSGGATLYLLIGADKKRTLTIHRADTYPEQREAATFLDHWPEALPSPRPKFEKQSIPEATLGHGWALVASWIKPGATNQPEEAQPAPEPAPTEVQIALF